MSKAPLLAICFGIVPAAVVNELGAALARIWTVNEGEKMLELRASSRLCTPLDGDQARIPVGAYPIGRIAAQRKPHLTNQVIGDAGVQGQAWARNEGVKAFAGYPLIVEGRLVSVIGMFSRHLRPAARAARARHAPAKAFQNLIGNAIKYRSEDVTPTVHTHTPITISQRLLELINHLIARRFARTGANVVSVGCPWKAAVCTQQRRISPSISTAAILRAPESWN